MQEVVYPHDTYNMIPVPFYSTIKVSLFSTKSRKVDNLTEFLLTRSWLEIIAKNGRFGSVGVRSSMEFRRPSKFTDFPLYQLSRTSG